ncbi:MAG: helix-turn-helix domain-containing protein [Firmicutes bacterium]|nr:helix-turn-helix domain-containing protein [Bacillota bacterium]
MNQYVTGNAIKNNRERIGLTQAELAERLGVSDKAVSKWETGRSYPDITLLEPLAQALGLSTIELLSGESVTNNNRAFNMSRSKFYVCPVCGNVMIAAGEAVISCCGIVLPALEAEAIDDDENEHQINIEPVEDEYYVTVDHPMTKEHYISFIAAVAGNRIEMTKLYPEGSAEARFKTSLTKQVYFYCNKHGLFVKNIRRKK